MNIDLLQALLGYQLPLNWWQGLPPRPSVRGVYIIWRPTVNLPPDYLPQMRLVIKVGQAQDVLARVRELLADDQINFYRRVDGHEVHLQSAWAAVSPPQLDGVERFLGESLYPVVAERFPDVPAIPVTLPHLN